MGPYRATFLIESVADLRKNLQERRSDLVVRIGRPESVLLEVVKAVGADVVYIHREVSHDEVKAEEKVEEAMKDEGVEVKYFWGSTLYHMDDLPFKLEEMPTNYGSFKEKVKALDVRNTIEALDRMKGLPKRGDVEPGEIPSLVDLGLNPNAATGQTLGIGHEFSSFIWLCGPITDLVVQPCVGIWSDKCSSKYGRRRPFILVGSLMISVAVIIIGYSADIGYMLGDTKEHCSTFKGTRTRAAFVFVIGFWMLDLANNTVQGPARALLADLSDEKLEPLSWELRVQIALDVARGLEYLHDGIKNLLPQLPHQPQLLHTVCLIIGSYSKWLDAAPSGTSFLWLLINILVSGMSVSEDTAAAEDSLHLVEALSMVIT